MPTNKPKRTLREMEGKKFIYQDRKPQYNKYDSLSINLSQFGT